MATGRSYGAKEFGVIVGIQDQSASALGTAPTTSQFVSGTKILMGLSSINDIAWDAGYQRAETSRTGRRALRAEDVINHYGSGSWTWDFDWIVDNEIGLQNLMNLIYPSTATTAASTDGLVVIASPTVESYAHGVGGTPDSMATIIIQNPEADEDRLMHSAVLQNLTLSMAAGTNSGRLNASGQFYSGYKPVIGANTFSADDGESDFDKGLFDCGTHTIETVDVSVSAFSVTLSNPATRVGYQGSAGEADGYVRANQFGVTGSITIKADSAAMDLLEGGWQNNATKSIVLSDGSTGIFFTIHEANISGHNLSIADEGTMVEIPFTATSGLDGVASLITIKAT